MCNFCVQPGCWPEGTLSMKKPSWAKLVSQVNCREPLLEYFSPMADDCATLGVLHCMCHLASASQGPEEWVKSYHEDIRGHGDQP